MIGQEEANHFLNRKVGVLYEDNGRDVFVRGYISQIFENSLMLRFFDQRECVISFSVIKTLREVDSHV